MSLLAFNSYKSHRMKANCVIFQIILLIILGMFVYRSVLSSNKIVIARPAKPGKKIEKMGYICSGLGGRLGNLMFQFAAGYGTARKYNKYFIFRDTYPFLNRTFKIGKWISLEQRCDTVWVEEAWGKYGNLSRVLSSSSNRSISMGGYLQSWRYFDGYTNEIRSLFTFRKDIMSEANNIINQIRKINNYGELTNGKSPVKIIAVHVRLGDTYRSIDMDFFAKALDYLKQRLGNGKLATVLVCEELAVCRKAFTDHVVWFSNCKSPACDMAVLSLADAVVILHFSSFGWWGAWLSRKIVVYNKQPMSGKPQLAQGLSTYDYFPRHWISL